MIQNTPLRILVAPLDWGLGHTTRCIPIIYELLNNGVQVLLAGNEVQKNILLNEFPTCTFLSLKGYNVSYGRSTSGFVWKMTRQLPAIQSAIRYENNWLDDVVSEYQIDGVISDNRFGLYHSNVPSVFITHQLQIKTGLGQYSDKLARLINYRFINKFSQCWVPDFSGSKNLAGTLSHPDKMPRIVCRYIGSLSRMSYQKQEQKNGKILIVLSGPEPQRSIFEQQIFDQLANFKGAVTIVRGLPLSTDAVSLQNAIVHNHLSKEKLQAEMLAADGIICRSGYSSVMDINALKIKAVLVPTPGQTEQEYLGKYLQENGFAVSFSQQNFQLNTAVEAFKAFSYNGFLSPSPELLVNAVADFIALCQSAKNKGRH